MATNSYAELAAAIDRTDGHTLRKILKAMAYTLEAARKEAEKYLLPTVTSKKRKSTESGEEPARKLQAPRAAPQKEPTSQASRNAKCKNCWTTFDVSKNRVDSCQMHHSAGVSVDTDFFEDDDIVTYGNDWPDDWLNHWYFTDWPEGFTWDCCGKRGNEETCLVQKHVAA